VRILQVRKSFEKEWELSQEAKIILLSKEKIDEETSLSKQV